MKTIQILGLLLVSLCGFSAKAQISTHYYSGTIMNNPFLERCALNQVNVQFKDEGAGVYTVAWQEQGFGQEPMNGFCEIQYDARLTPSGKLGEWNVDFFWKQELIFGRAILKNGKLEITATYENAGLFNDFFTRMSFEDEKKQMSYFRQIEPFSGPSLTATGVLIQSD